MSFMKMASMASASMILVLVLVMFDSAMPETFIRLAVMAFLMVVTGFLGYRLMLAFNMIQEQGKSKSVPKATMYGVYALVVLTLVTGGTALYLLLNPVWSTGVVAAGSMAVFLVFLVSRSVLQIDLLPLLGIEDDTNS